MSIHKLLSPIATHPQKERIFAIASGKGGVGKTWFSIALSHALSKEHQSVLLFDADFGLANIDIQLGLSPLKDLDLFISGRESLTQISQHYEIGGFDIISGHSGSDYFNALSHEKRQVLYQALLGLSNKYRYILLDLAAGIDANVLEFATLAQHCLVVLTHEPTSLTDAYALIKKVSQAHTGTMFHVVVNMVDNAAQAEESFATLKKTCEAFLQITPTYLGFIHRDKKIPETIYQQNFFTQKYPHNKPSLDVEKIASAVLKLMRP